MLLFHHYHLQGAMNLSVCYIYFLGFKFFVSTCIREALNASAHSSFLGIFCHHPKFITHLSNLWFISRQFYYSFEFILFCTNYLLLNAIYLHLHCRILVLNLLLAILQNILSIKLVGHEIKVRSCRMHVFLTILFILHIR